MEILDYQYVLSSIFVLGSIYLPYGHSEELYMQIIAPERSSMATGLQSAVRSAVRNVNMASRRQRNPLRQAGLYLNAGITFTDRESPTPEEIVDLFCDKMFPNNASVIMSINYGELTSTSNTYILNIARQLGYPVISWDPFFPGALESDESSLVLQIGPTIFHQCQGILQILERYNWTDFSVVTSAGIGRDFIDGMAEMVKRTSITQGYLVKPRFTNIATVVIDFQDEVVDFLTDAQTAYVRKELRTLVKARSRVILLHTKSTDTLNIFEVAESMGLTGLRFAWVLTSSSVGSLVSRGTSLPLGLLAVSPNSTESKIEEAIHTAITVWSTGLKSIVGGRRRSETPLSPHFDCTGATNTSAYNGRAVYNAMKDVVLANPGTPPVSFSTNGIIEHVSLDMLNSRPGVRMIRNRPRKIKTWDNVGRIFPELGRYGKVEMKIETNEIVWPALSPSPPIGRPEKRFFRIVTKQEHPYMMYRPPDEDGLCGHHEVPCTVNGYNLPGNSTENGTLAYCCTGLCVEVLGILAERMNFEYDLYDVPDGQWGVEIFRKTTAEETSQNIDHSTSVDSPDSPVDSGDDANREGACGDGDDTASVGDDESTGDDDDTSTEDSESKSDDTVSVATTTGGHSFVPYWQGQVGVVRGSLTQFTIKSRYQGNQCTSMSYTALCWAFVIPIDIWTSAIIDDILRAGNNMHNEFRDTLLLSTEADGRISIDDVPLAFSLDVCGVPCISNRGEVTHTFSSLSPEIAGFAKEAGLLSIQDFIESESRHVNESTGFLVTVMAYTYMIFRTSDDRWHVFDSHGCLRYAVDEVIGSQNETSNTTEWTGLLGEIVEGRADLIMTAFLINQIRSTAVDFSIPYLESGITIMVSIRKGAISPYAFLEPYDFYSWILILIFSVHATGASIFIFEWLSPSGLVQGKGSSVENKFSLFRSFWLIWAMLFGAAVSIDIPRGVSSRFLSNVWALFALVFLASYTANLAAFMITIDEYFDLSGIEDWRLIHPTKLTPHFKFATVSNSSTDDNLRVNYPRMHKYMMAYNQSDVAAARLALKTHQIHAFIYDANVLEYTAGRDEDCSLLTVGRWYAMSGYGIGLPMGSDLLDEINEIILDLQHNGEIERLQAFWQSGACHAIKDKKDKSANRIGILNFISAFYLLACGVLLGLVLMALEHLYFKSGRKCVKKYDKCGCCSLVSLSMGQSLTFKQSVFEAIDIQKRHKCTDPVCEMHLWKAKHQLDMALLKVKTLEEQVSDALSTQRRSGEDLLALPSTSAAMETVT